MEGCRGDTLSLPTQLSTKQAPPGLVSLGLQYSPTNTHSVNRGVCA